MLSNKQEELNAEHVAFAISLIPAITGMARKMGLAPDKVEDSINDAFVHLVTYALPSWNGRGSRKTFATQAAKNKITDIQFRHRDNKKAHRAKMPTEGEVGTDMTEHLKDDSNLSARVEASDLIARAMKVLTSAEAELLAAVQQSGGNWSEAARAVGMSLSSAGRARQSIQAKIKELQEE